jgi:hypothetical protein
MWCSSDLAGTAQNASVCAAKALQPITASVNTERRLRKRRTRYFTLLACPTSPGGLSRALASPRLLIHNRGRVTADLACAIADGGEVISDFRVMTDQKELFGSVASVPTMWRTLDEIAAGGPQAPMRLRKNCRLV